MNSIFIGFDPREAAAYAVCRSSIDYFLTQQIPVKPIILDEMRDRGLYWRKTEWKQSAADKPVLWDVISEAPMSTEFAISRFLTPHLARTGWALFMDCDMLARTNFARLFDAARSCSDYAVMCVKHQYAPTESVKMDGQLQTTYSRKNWSSFMLFNCSHPSNKKLTVKMINALPGRDLHRFCWLEDHEIGELDAGWNWLVGEQPEPSQVRNVHFTQGGPWFHGYEDVPYAEQWRQQLYRWAS
jgi:lipopolysaccharide biosynthesis glycosyltransferase